MDLLRVEQQRQALEKSLIEIRSTLKHWQTLDAEYEGLKEEFQNEPSVLDAVRLEHVAQTYNADLINADEIRKLVALDTDTPRTLSEIVRVIDHRQDYVQSSIETLQRRFFDAEAKLEEFDFAASRDVETGLPLTEIHEELDDDDNIISARLSQPEQAQGQLVESLRKAGLTEEDLGPSKAAVTPLKPAIINASPIPSPPPTAGGNRSPTSDAVEGAGPTTQRPAVRKKSVSFSIDTKEPVEMSRTDSEEGRKSVSFANKVAVAPAAPPPDTRSVSFSSKVEEIPTSSIDPPHNVPAQADHLEAAIQKELRASFKPGDRVIRLDDDDEIAGDHIVLPENESEEDAALRREMLEYHLNEVGHVVAELDIDDAYGDGDDEDEVSSHYTGSTYPDDDTTYTSLNSDENYEDEDDEEDDYSEDEYGRSKHSVLSASYRKQMLELQERLIGNLGPSPKMDEVADMDSEGIDPKDVRRLVVLDQGPSEAPTQLDASEKKSANKKRVSFAESIEVGPNGTNEGQASSLVAGGNVEPVVSGILERRITGPQADASKPEQPTGNRQDSVAAGSEQPVDLDNPSGPPGKILAETLVERPASSSATALSRTESETLMQRRELAAEYYRRRNDLIRQQGGFKQNDEDEELGELMEERYGKVKKVSRFKAARIKS